MASDLTMQLDSDSYVKVMNQLNGLSKLEKSAVIEQGLKDAGNVIAEQTKKNITSKSLVKSGKMLKSVKVKLNKKERKVSIGFVKKTGGQAHLLEKGTTTRYTKKKHFVQSLGKMVKYTGAVKAYNFQTDSVEQKKDEAMAVLTESIQNSINMILNR